MDTQSGERRKARWGDVARGALGVALAVGAIGLEAYRNAIHGLTLGGFAYGAGYALFAVGLLVVPVLIQRYGGWLLLGAYLLCLALTGWAGLSYYAGDIRAAIEASATHEAAAQAAKGDARDADAEISELEARLRLIRETAGSEALRAAMEAARQRVKVETENRGGCPAMIKRDGRMVESACRLAEIEAEGFARRMVDAQARESYEGKLAEVRARRDQARALVFSEAPRTGGGAFVLARLFGGSEGQWQRVVGVADPVAMVLAQLALAALLGPSLRLLQEGWAGAPVPALPAVATVEPRMDRRQRAQRAAQVEQPAPQVEQSAPPEEVAELLALSREERLARFISERMQPGGRTEFAEIQGELERWWRRRFPSEAPASKGQLGEALKAAGLAPWRTSTARGYCCTLSAEPGNAPKCPAGRLALSYPEGDRAQVCHQPAL